MSRNRVCLTIFLSVLCFMLSSLSWLYLIRIPEIAQALVQVNMGGMARLLADPAALSSPAVYAQVFAFFVVQPFTSFSCGMAIVSIVSYFMMYRPVYFDGTHPRKLGLTIVCVYLACVALCLMVPSGTGLFDIVARVVTASANNVSNAPVSSPILILAGCLTSYGVCSKRVRVQPVRGWF